MYPSDFAFRIFNSNILLAVGKSSRGIRAARLPSRDSQRSHLVGNNNALLEGNKHRMIMKY